MGSRKRYTKAELIKQVQGYAAELGRTPTSPEFEANNNTASAITVAKYFGGWVEFLEAAGLSQKNRGYTNEELIAQLRNLEKELNKVPSMVDFNRHPETASFSTIKNKFKNWHGFLTAAGYS
jgi:hypothetical protein